MPLLVLGEIPHDPNTQFGGAQNTSYNLAQIVTDVALVTHQPCVVTVCASHHYKLKYY